MKSAMTAILRDASGKMHHGILFDRRLVNTGKNQSLKANDPSRLNAVKRENKVSWEFFFSANEKIIPENHEINVPRKLHVTR